MLTSIVVLFTLAQAPTASPAAPAPQRPSQASPAAQSTPKRASNETYPAEQVRAGATMFAAQCGFCHGRDATGGQTGPDLTRSTLVAEDARGDKIIPVVRTGRPDKGMPPFNLSDADLAALVAFIHDQQIKAESQQGGRRAVDESDLQTGDARAGQAFFNGAGGCARCHSPSGDLADVAARLKGLELLQRMLYPSGRGGARTPAKATVTLASGQAITGRLAYRDEFLIAIKDAEGWQRSWRTSDVKVTIDDPLEAHAALLPKYTDTDMHNVLAYLQTLRQAVKP
ncbi:MAG: cytochrome c [Acidobacteria bacterium]|nr:cytochrome c [Acidobacteriota bacterium]